MTQRFRKHIYVNDPFDNRLELLQPICLMDWQSVEADRPPSQPK